VQNALNELIQQKITEYQNSKSVGEQLNGGTLKIGDMIELKFRPCHQTKELEEKSEMRKQIIELF